MMLPLPCPRRSLRLAERNSGRRAGEGGGDLPLPPGCAHSPSTSESVTEEMDGTASLFPLTSFFFLPCPRNLYKLVKDYSDWKLPVRIWKETALEGLFFIITSFIRNDVLSMRKIIFLPVHLYGVVFYKGQTCIKAHPQIYIYKHNLRKS